MLVDPGVVRLDFIECEGPVFPAQYLNEGCYYRHVDFVIDIVHHLNRPCETDSSSVIRSYRRISRLQHSRIHAKIFDVFDEGLDRSPLQSFWYHRFTCRGPIDTGVFQFLTFGVGNQRAFGTEWTRDQGRCCHSRTCCHRRGYKTKAIKCYGTI